MSGFENGCAALIVSTSSWYNDRWYRSVTVNKVHRNNRLTLTENSEQWRPVRNVSEYVRCGSTGHSEVLHLDTPELRAEIDAEIVMKEDRIKLNKLGTILKRMRSNKDGSFFWNSMPDELKDMVK